MTEKLVDAQEKEYEFVIYFYSNKINKIINPKKFRAGNRYYDVPETTDNLLFLAKQIRGYVFDTHDEEDAPNLNLLEVVDFINQQDTPIKVSVESIESAEVLFFADDSIVRLDVEFASVDGGIDKSCFTTIMSKRFVLEENPEKFFN